MSTASNIATAPCYKCSGTGVYSISRTTAGKCFTCKGKGFQDAADIRRCAYYHNGRVMPAAKAVVALPLSDAEQYKRALWAAIKDGRLSLDKLASSRAKRGMNPERAAVLKAARAWAKRQRAVQAAA